MSKPDACLQSHQISLSQWAHCHDCTMQIHSGPPSTSYGLGWLTRQEAERGARNTLTSSECGQTHWQECTPGTLSWRRDNHFKDEPCQSS